MKIGDRVQLGEGHGYEDGKSWGGQTGVILSGPHTSVNMGITKDRYEIETDKAWLNPWTGAKQKKCFLGVEDFTVLPPATTPEVCKCNVWAGCTCGVFQREMDAKRMADCVVFVQDNYKTAKKELDRIFVQAIDERMHANLMAYYEAVKKERITADEVAWCLLYQPRFPERNIV